LENCFDFSRQTAALAAAAEHAQAPGLLNIQKKWTTEYSRRSSQKIKRKIT